MKIIQNEAEIRTNELRGQALDIIKSGLRQVCPHSLLDNTIRYNQHFNSLIVQNNDYDLISGRLFVIGGGKAAGYMAEKFEAMIGAENITAGVVSCDSDNYKTKVVEVVKAGHPFPNKQGQRAVKKMLLLKEEFQINEKDLLVCFLSGGGSSLLTYPVEGISLKDSEEITRTLIESGANIHEINAVRKHISRIKGGQLAIHFQPTRIVSLVISDVVGDMLEVIASGPTVMDPTTFQDAALALEKYRLMSRIPRSVRDHIRAGCDGARLETPKQVDNSDTYVIGNNSTALEAMALKAKSLGYKPLIVGANLFGDPGVMARGMADEVKRGEFKGYNALILGGETTPQLPSRHGRGGRNLHFVAATLLAMQNFPGDWAMISASTDGEDYLTGYAGAIIDRHSLSQVIDKHIHLPEMIKNYDSLSIFKKLPASLIKTGSTGTNVGDIAVYLFPE